MQVTTTSSHLLTRREAAAYLSIGPRKLDSLVAICNVEPADVDQLLDAIKLLTTAASHEQQTLDQQSRWTLAGKEVE